MRHIGVKLKGFMRKIQVGMVRRGREGGEGGREGGRELSTIFSSYVFIFRLEEVLTASFVLMRLVSDHVL